MMSNSKNYNSIVFLTTLSVYLGLVLIGAPPILAHAAMTRHFDIQNEIEVKDDLDKKPDDEIEKIREIDITQALIIFVEDLQKLRSIGKYNPLDENVFSKQNTYSIGRSSIQNPPNAWVSLAADEFFEKLFINNFEKLVDKSKSQSNERFLKTTCKFKIVLDKSIFELKIEIIKDSSQASVSLAENLNHLFQLKIDQSTDLSVKSIYESTNITYENNQVFIITRLPRGSLDALLARKDAQ